MTGSRYPFLRHELALMVSYPLVSMLAVRT